MALDPSSASIAGPRLAAQRIARPRGAIADVVAAFGALQAQDPLGVRWAVALRTGAKVTQGDVDHAIARGEVVRTHTLRGTWQLVSPADLRWQLTLVEARVVRSAARRHAQLGLTEKMFAKANTVLARALAKGDHDRAELAALLGGAGIPADGVRLSHVLLRAELAGVVCGGPRRGKQPTWTLLDAHVAPARKLTRDEALVELARRYFTTRGPATSNDFAWWSGLSAAEARAGLEAVKGELGTHADTAVQGVHLLPAFDEYVVSYRDRSAILDAPDATRVGTSNGILGPFLVVDGRVVGLWSRTLEKAGVRVDVKPFPSRAKAVRARRDEVVAAAERYAAFLGTDLAGV
jgi:hypothetical protein